MEQTMEESPFLLKAVLLLPRVGGSVKSVIELYWHAQKVFDMKMSKFAVVLPLLIRPGVAKLSYCIVSLSISFNIRLFKYQCYDWCWNTIAQACCIQLTVLVLFAAWNTVLLLHNSLSDSSHLETHNVLELLILPRFTMLQFEFCLYLIMDDECTRDMQECDYIAVWDISV